MEKRHLEFFRDLRFSGYPNFDYLGGSNLNIKNDSFLNLKFFLECFNESDFEKEYDLFFKDEINYDYFNWIALGIISVCKNDNTYKFDVRLYNEELVTEIEIPHNHKSIETKYELRSIGFKEFKEYMVLSYLVSDFTDFFTKLDDCSGQEVKKAFALRNFKNLSECLVIIKSTLQTYQFCITDIVRYLKLLESITYHFLTKLDLYDFDPLLKFYFDIDKASVGKEIGFNENKKAEKIYNYLFNNNDLDDTTTKEAFINVLSFQNTQEEIIYWLSDLKSFVAFFISLIKQEDLYCYYKNKSGKTRIYWQKFNNSVLIKGEKFNEDSAKSTKIQVGNDKNYLKKIEKIIEKI